MAVQCRSLEGFKLIMSSLSSYKGQICGALSVSLDCCWLLELQPDAPSVHNIDLMLEGSCCVSDVIHGAASMLRSAREICIL